MWVWLGVLFLCGTVTYGQTAGSSTNDDRFHQKIAPLLNARCAACHGGANPAAGLSVASLSLILSGGKNGAALEPGDSKQSLMIQHLRGERAPKMPMGGSLSSEEINTLAAAIDGMQPLPKTAKAPEIGRAHV